MNRFSVLALVFGGALCLGFAMYVGYREPQSDAKTPGGPAQASDKAESKVARDTQREDDALVAGAQYRAISDRVAELERIQRTAAQRVLRQKCAEAVQKIVTEMQSESLRYPEESDDRLALVWYAEDLLRREKLASAEDAYLSTSPEVTPPREVQNRIGGILSRYMPKLKAAMAQAGMDSVCSLQTQFNAEAARHPAGSVERAAWLEFSNSLGSKTKLSPPSFWCTWEDSASAVTDSWQSDLGLSKSMPRSKLRRWCMLREGPNDVLKQLHEVDKTAFTAEIRGYLAPARAERLTALATVRKSLPEDHFVVRMQESLLADHAWLAGISDDDRSIAQQAYRDIQFALESVTDATDRIASLESAIKRLESIRSPLTDVLLRANQELAVAQLWLDDADAAEETSDKLTRLASQSRGNDPTIRYMVEWIHGAARWQNHDLHGGLRSFCNALILSYQLGIVDPSEAEALNQCALILMVMDEHRRAQECLNKIAGISRAANVPLRPTLKFYAAFLNFEIAYAQSKVDELKPHADECYAIATNELSSDDIALCHAFMQRCRIAKLERRFDAAWNCVADAETALGTRISDSQRASLLAERLSIRTLEHRYDEAVELAATYVKEYSDSGISDPYANNYCFDDYSEALEALGRKEEARQMKDRADELHKRCKEARDKIRNDPECRLPWERKSGD